MSEKLASFLAPVKDSKDNILNYGKYSIVHHAKRKLSVFTACNIDGSKFRKLKRDALFGGSDHWSKDPRIPAKLQWGSELYRAPKSDFDKGHLTKREDTQWGRSFEEARNHAMETFYYTNAAPQHAALNRSVWRRIENYILHKDAISRGTRITVFTGPVLQDNDPVFVSKVKGEFVQIPILFWKLVYFIGPKDKSLYRIGFLVGQEDLLRKDGIISKSRSLDPENNPFSDFELAKTYQVHPKLIESLTSLTFADAKDPIQRDQKSEIVLKKVQMKSRSLDSRATAEQEILDGIMLG